MTKILIVGSGHSANEYFDYSYKNNEWIIVAVSAVSNAWRLTKDWDYCVHAKDMPKENYPEIYTNQKIISHSEYTPVLTKFGGHRECGYSIVLAASYWSLEKLQPEVIGYLGCDMIYTPNEKGHTHFYGIGYDISKYNKSDPDLMIEKYGKNNPQFLKELYNRFRIQADNLNCNVFNFSSLEQTRLPYQKKTPKEVDLKCH